MREIPITLTESQWSLITKSLNLLDRQLVELCIDKNAGKREWNEVYDIETVIKTIEYGIAQNNIDSKNNV